MEHSSWHTKIERLSTPSRRGLLVEEWLCFKGVCAIVELVKHVNVAIQGGEEDLLSGSIFLCHELCWILHEGEVGVIDWAARREGSLGGHANYIDADELMDDSRTVLNVVLE